MPDPVFPAATDPLLSIIPYDTNRQIVLRHADSVVFFDPRSCQLSLSNGGRDLQSREQSSDRCPTCQRPYDNDGDVVFDNEDEYSPPEDQPSFINHEYFQLLARSLPTSRDISPPTSPRLRLAHDTHSYLNSAREAVLEPPPHAEFVDSTPAPSHKANGISDAAFSPGYFKKFFVEERELGRGGKGVVLLVRHVLDNVSLGRFACKRVPVGDDHSWLEKVLIEVQLLQALSHQNLVSYRHVWLEDYQISTFGPSIPCAFILQQYCNGGDLHNYICAPAQSKTTAQNLKDRIRKRSKGENDMPRKLNAARRLSLNEIKAFFTDITDGLQYLHLNNFIHRDLKPQNCLLHNVNGELRVLVSDFGEVQYENAVRKSTGATGTISYCAPEVLQPISPGGPLGNFTTKSDIFSLGMILHFLCFADLPYKNANVLNEEQEDLDDLRTEIVAWAGFSDLLYQRSDLPKEVFILLKQLLSLHPSDRPSAKDVFQTIRGQVDSVPELKRRPSSVPEELTPGKRVVPIDDSTTAGVLSRASRPPNTDRSPSHRNRHQSPVIPSFSQENSEQNSPEYTPSSTNEDLSSSMSSAMMKKSSSRGLPRRLSTFASHRERRSSISSSPQSPPPYPSDPPTRMINDPETIPPKQQLLLEAPPPHSSFLTTIANLLSLRFTNFLIRFPLFVLKLFTMGLLSSHTWNRYGRRHQYAWLPNFRLPELVILVAGVELSLRYSTIGRSIGFMVLHVLLLYWMWTINEGQID